MYQFKAKDYEIKYYTLCLGNFPKDFTINNMKKNKIKWNWKTFFVDFDLVDTNDILDTHKYLMKGMKGIWHKIMFGFIKKLPMGLWAGIVRTFNHKMCKVHVFKQSEMYNSTYSY